ncbi:MAG: TonB family protein [Muribaculaceae bacterium]|nr:TonB family protein [Muribaculaceae bacterium]
MGVLFSYSIISSVLLCCGYVVYKWLFSTERQHGYNRILIYGIYLLSLLLPLLLTGTGISEANIIKGREGIDVGYPVPLGTLAENGVSGHSLPLFRILLGLYVIGIVGMTIYSLFGVIQLQGIIRKGERIAKEGYILILTDNERIAPFSWMKYVVMSKEDYERVGEVIIIHEQRHLQYRHWVDLIFAQIILIFQWFNPGAWLFREEFKTVHEYQADEAVLVSGANIREYQMLLIKKAVGTRFHSLANSLNHSKLKKRVTMMYKEKSSMKRRLGALLLLPAMAIGCVAVQIPAFAGFLDAESETMLFSRSEGKVSKKTPINLHSETVNPVVAVKKVSSASAVSPVGISVHNSEPMKNEAPSSTKSEMEAPGAINAASEENAPGSGEEIYTAVQETAQPDGGMKALLDYLHKNIEYPEEAIKEGKEGRVIVRFVVEKDGRVGPAEIVKGVAPVLDKEALRVVNMMPKWTPAKVDGEPVASYYVVPVAFTLPKDEEKAE